MTDVKSLHAKAVFNDQKITDFLSLFIPDYEAGRISIEEIKEALIDNLIDFVDIKVTSGE